MARAVPTASVVVAAHNDADGLAATIESALDCALIRPLEIVAVNDCSTDETWRRLLEIKERQPEVHLVDLGARYGEVVARLEGARRAAGSLVCFAAPGSDITVLASVLEADSRPRSEVVAELEADPDAKLEPSARPVVCAWGDGRG